MKILIVDDEQAARQGLEKLLLKFTQDVSYIDTASSVKEAIEKIENQMFDVVFLDIQMPGGNGFTLFDEIENPDFSVIFTTAHSEYAIQAFRVGAVDYLLKPIDPDALIEATNKVKSQLVSTERKLNQTTKTKIGVPLSTGIKFINIDQIIRLESERNYTTICIANDKPVLISKPLKEFESALDNHDFLRVHNSHIVNLQYVKEYQRSIQGMLLMEDDFQVPISRSSKDMVKHKLNQIFGIV